MAGKAIFFSDLFDIKRQKLSATLSAELEP